MKLLVVSSVDGQLSILNNLFRKHPETTLAVSVGDMNLFSESSPLPAFLRDKHRDQAKEPVLWNLQGRRFIRPVYHIYGSMDDPFVPQSELNIGLLNPIWSSVVPFAADNGEVKKLAFFGGYYNNQQFKLTNPHRAKHQRRKQSLALCSEDFEAIKNKPFDYLFAYESPYGRPFGRRGCPAIWPLVDKATLTFYGHHRTIQIDEKHGLIGLPPLEYGYLIFDVGTGNYTIYFKITGSTDYRRLRTGGVNSGETILLGRD